MAPLKCAELTAGRTAVWESAPAGFVVVGKRVEFVVVVIAVVVASAVVVVVGGAGALSPHLRRGLACRAAGEQQREREGCCEEHGALSWN